MREGDTMYTHRHTWHKSKKRENKERERIAVLQCCRLERCTIRDPPSMSIHNAFTMYAYTKKKKAGDI